MCKSFAEKQLLLVTGYRMDIENQAEVITSAGTKRCPILDYPIGVARASGALLKDTILVCGGGDANWNPVNNCYSSTGSQWVPHANLKTARRLSSGIPLSDSTMWIVGGVGPNHERLSSTELVHLDKKVEEGPKLDQPLSSFCIITHQKKIYIMGGWTESGRTKNVHIYDQEDVFLPPNNGPAMIHNRGGHSCTIFNSPGHENRPVAVVAGGVDLVDNKSAELWDFTQPNSKWIESKPFFDIFEKTCP